MKKENPTPVPKSRLAELLTELVVTGEGFLPSRLPGVRLMRSSETYPSTPVSYEPSIIFIAQGRKVGRLGDRVFRYDPGSYLVLSVPLPFECETIGTRDEPLLGLSVRVNPALVAELLLEEDALPTPPSLTPDAIGSVPLTSDLLDAAERLARCLRSPAEARILGPQIVREITYRVLCDRQGPALRALAAPQSHFAQIARALRRIHTEFAETIDVAHLAREAGMSLSTFHAHFKAVTAHPPQRYLQKTRLHKAHTLMISGVAVAEAAHRVGYESPSQFSREFKRLFGGTPREVTVRSQMALGQAPVTG
jgi:AraC-like DNA-binding protein